MNNVARWNPFRELDDLHARLSSYLSPASGRGDGGRENMTVAEWAPAVDITEDDGAYVIRAELSDVKKDDVHVRVDAGVLTIHGERKLEKEEKNKRYHRVERSYGSFVRRFGVPEDADGDRIEAAFKDGVLEVRLPKHEVAKPKSVEIKVG
ncbi:MAG: Hsp20/alpha crystallin family protein [Verrucomicrobia bacterium]|nr:Hsp20/alpha crystallin family protein [Verrucomicrobiota bacterium]